uniref:Uncharacterized protein n=1 Tax=Lutzomyia longipalpis TaxID=7200 RepID=A0A1B0GH80_LUTLO
MEIMTESKKVKKGAEKITEEKALVSRGVILNSIQGMQKNLGEKSKEKKSILDSDFKYSLQITLFKIPRGAGRLNKMLLTHSLIDDTDEVCLVVKDLERGAKKDFEPTNNHFEEVLRVAGVTRINRILSVNELKKNYGPFEAKLKLCQSFEVFLVDSRVYNRTVPLLGKHFLKRKKLPIALKMDCEDLNEAIAKALKYTIYRQSNSGNVLSIDVGKHRMTAEDITDNVCQVINHLKSDTLGGWNNI